MFGKNKQMTDLRNNLTNNQLVIDEVSCVMSVYHGDKVDWVTEAINSVLQGTRVPGEFLIYFDGVISSKIVEKINRIKNSTNTPIYVYSDTQCRGRAFARQRLVEMASRDYVMMMDADDVCVPNRLELQHDFFLKYPDVDVLGGWVVEFGENWPEYIRVTPETNNQIRLKGRFVQPINHVTLMAKKQAILDVGGYLDAGSCEDYWLIARMMCEGLNLRNIPSVLVNVRVSSDFASRRHGFKKAKDEIEIAKYFRKKGELTIAEFGFIVVSRIILRLSPSFLMKHLYYFNRCRRKDLPQNL